MKKENKQAFMPMLYPLFAGAGFVIGHVVFDEMLYGIIVGSALGIILSSLIGYNNREKENQEEKGETEE